MYDFDISFDNKLPRGIPDDKTEAESFRLLR